MPEISCTESHRRDLLGEHVTEALDVHRPAGGEVPHSLVDLRGTRGVGTTCHRFALGMIDGNAPQTGHASGIVKIRSLPVRASIMGATTRGITSPARVTSTVSPIRISLLAIYSALCNVAFLTVTPPICTGSSTAFEVSTIPVRPMRNPDIRAASFALHAA